MENKTGPVNTKAVIGAQKIIDLMINAYAPDVSKSEIYAKYGDNFFMNNEAPFKSALAIIDSTIVDENAFNTFMEDVKNELEKQNEPIKEKMDLAADLVENEKNVDKSPEIKESSAPVVDNVKTN